MFHKELHVLVSLMIFNEIADKVEKNQSITTKEAEQLYLNGSDEQLSQLATISKNFHHQSQDSQATYLVMAIINYTNICVAACDYCSFYRLPHQSGTYLLNFDEICKKIDNLLTLGGTLISFNGGFHPKLKIWSYADLFDKIHNRYPNLTFYEMTVAEFMFSCKLSKITYQEGAQILKDAGCQWITGGGAEILDDHFRSRHSPGKFTTYDYFQAQKDILDAGIGSTATMVIGFDETLDERLNHLEKLRTFQSSLHRKLPSFLCWTYKPWNNSLGGNEISNHEYLRWLAICRIYLNNFKHIRTSILTRNEDGLLGLKFGANDFDLPTEDEVTQKAGATISHEFEDILISCEKLGFTPRNRSPFEFLH